MNGEADSMKIQNKIIQIVTQPEGLFGLTERGEVYLCLSDGQKYFWRPIPLEIEESADPSQLSLFKE